MGNVIASTSWERDTVPIPETKPTFAPDYGFPRGRKERVSSVTEDEMLAAKIPIENRDYCADKYLKILACKEKHFPIMYKCRHEKHEYGQCQFEDYVLRMKEYERERRLRVKEKKKKEAAMKEESS